MEYNLVLVYWVIKVLANTWGVVPQCAATGVNSSEGFADICSAMCRIMAGCVILGNI